MTAPDDPVVLVNLTGHAVNIDGADRAGPPVVLSGTNDRAFVEEPLDGQSVLQTAAGAVREVRLWRSETVQGLPEPSPGTRYVVPRLTALAASDRDDLLFPHQELRTAGVVSGAGVLGRFMPPLVQPREAYKPPRTLRLLVRTFGRGLRAAGWSDVPAITRWTGVTFAVATALVGAALGAGPSIAESPGRWRYWLLLIGGGLVGVLILRAGLQLWRHREEVLTQRGTAYVIEETAEAWTYEEKRRFIEQLAGHFPSVQRVPGPGELGENWHWPLGPGAEAWGSQVDALVRSFWSVHFNDNPLTDDSVLMWAWWPISISFAARATACRRGLTLLVRQRPSDGRIGQVPADGWRQEPHDFASRPGIVVREGEVPERTVQLTVVPRGTTIASQTDPPMVTILLVRTFGAPWGPLTPSTPLDKSIELTLDDAAGIGACGQLTATLREWRYMPPEDTPHAWADYPTIVQSATEWVGRVASALRGIVLLAALVPQEVGVGIGVLAGQRGTTWPAQLWPIQVDPDNLRHLVIPGLDLGADRLRRIGGDRDAV